MLPNPVSSNFLTSNSTAMISIPTIIIPWKGVRNYAYKTVNAPASFSASNLVFIVVIRSHGCLTDLDPRRSGLLSTFRKFTYDELKKATGKFWEEIGRGGGGVVYKGILSDHRVAAIKRLNEANQVEGELLAERILFLAPLIGRKRFDIAVGSAKGLTYLHKECLEWVLHCNVKPQNILLDSNFQPKVADFGLSKLANRGGSGKSSSFSRVRGTRFYMVPEWISNLPITSKVDVYSHGLVVLEMVTGKSPMTTGDKGSGNIGEMEQRGLVNWVREKMNGNGENKL
ncbi:hypothetical protein RHSIM_RhsimUnG0130700 [Rhododendron simsii]|uniref:Protein kinase domain-containing protein n=1 Tax=Rhododendron simsii TaxID=118357 RepID=A0A834FVU2_RHOSS|nr:hypothetical protein RHSIM_RhsimUnG0130700 [Rhododendron simsii]